MAKQTTYLMKAVLTFESVLKDHGSAMRRVIASYEASPALREEILQDAALAVWQSLPRLQDAGKAKAFVLRITHNKSIDHVARQVREPRSTSTHVDVPATDDPESDLIQGEGQSRLLRAIRQLPIGHRQVISLLLEDMSYREIAEILDVSVSNVGVRVNRAKAQLKEILKND